MTQWIGFLPVILVSITSLILLLKQNWRWTILSLSIQYVAIFWMILTVWPTGLAAVKLVTGWMAGALLGSSVDEERNSFKENSLSLQERRFRFALGVFTWIIILAIYPSIQNWLPTPTNLTLGGGILIANGLLQLGLSVHPLRVAIGLLTVFSGFELLYAGIEQSVTVAGFLAVITLGITFIGVFLINISQEKENA